MKAQTLALGLALSAPLASAYQGKMTNYQVSAGLTSCGTTHADSEMVVALSLSLMQQGWPGNPNDNPKCNTYISIWNPDTQVLTQNVKVVDSCRGCAMYDIDASDAVFAAVADPALDHGDGWEIVDWGGSGVGGKRDLGLETLTVGPVGKREPHHPHAKVAIEEKGDGDDTQMAG